MGVYVSGLYGRLITRTRERSETAKSTGAIAEFGRVDKDNLNLSGVTGTPAAARSTSDWQIESERTKCFAAVWRDI